MNTIMNTAEFIRVTDLLKKEKIAKNSGNIFAVMMAMRENRPKQSAQMALRCLSRHPKTTTARRTTRGAT